MNNTFINGYLVVCVIWIIFILAVATKEFGRHEVYVQAVETKHGRWLVDNNGVTTFTWNIPLENR